jgi:hypothetical protein
MTELTALDQKVIDAVRDVGWFCLSVGGDEHTPCFSYTIGLWESYGTPELIIFGLPPNVVRGMFHNAIEEIRGGKVEFDRARWNTLLDGYSCESRPFHLAHHEGHLNFANWYRGYRGEEGPVEAYQIFWPGVHDRLLPWEDGSHESVGAAQPFHWSPPH